MKLFFFFLSLACLCSTAHSQKIISDPNVEVRTVGSFTGISISDGIDLYLSAGEPAVAVSASSPEVRDNIITEVKDNVLRISYHSNSLVKLNINSERKLRAYVSGKVLKFLQASGGSDVLIDGVIKSNDLTIVLSGGSDLKGVVEVATLTVKQSGGSDVNISGKADGIVVHASGGSDFNGYDLITQTCTIEASGGSDIEVTTNKELTATASGASDISYKGTPAVKEVKVSGASSIRGRPCSPGSRCSSRTSRRPKAFPSARHSGRGSAARARASRRSLWARGRG